jgi:hypothetical protein
MIYVCGAVVLASMVACAAFVGTGWSWPLFVWGVALGLVSGRMLRMLGTYAFFRGGAQSETTARNAEVYRSRSPVVERLLLMVCTGMGIFSAAVGASVGLALATFLLGLGCVLQLVTGAAYRRRYRRT